MVATKKRKSRCFSPPQHIRIDFNEILFFISEFRIVTHVKHATRDLTQQNIAASYSLAAQFLSLAAAALQFPITSKLCWSDLGVIETSEARLASKLSRVNINIIKLCIKCGVDIR